MSPITQDREAVTPAPPSPHLPCLFPHQDEAVVGPGLGTAVGPLIPLPKGTCSGEVKGFYLGPTHMGAKHVFHGSLCWPAEPSSVLPHTSPPPSK
jgi:hypothetical protein